jgi:putative acetyltransferase
MIYMQELELSGYQKKYANDFKRLNLEWIEKYFVVEEHDLEQLSHPEEHIINGGGEILFALYNDDVAGVCALIKTGDDEFELAKMAVSPNFQGLQIGYKLGLHSIKIAKQMGAKRVWLESNRKLTPALNLYRKLGFKEIPLTFTPYARADIRMELMFE